MKIACNWQNGLSSPTPNYLYYIIKKKIGKLLTNYTASHCIVTTVRTSDQCTHRSFIDTKSLLFETGLMEYAYRYSTLFVRVPLRL
jgi:hypothetical protein